MSCDCFDMIEFAQSFDMGINFLLGPPTPSEVIFIPSVDADGWLSWSNNGGLPNPDPVNIKGPPGSGAVESVNGKTGEVTLTASDVGAAKTVYEAGDQVALGGTILVATKLSSGAMVCSIVLPKTVPTSLTITHNLTVAWVRGNGISDSTGLTVSNVSRASGNVLQIAVTGSTIPTLQAAVINISAGNISFS